MNKDSKIRQAFYEFAESKNVVMTFFHLIPY